MGAAETNRRVARWALGTLLGLGAVGALAAPASATYTATLTGTTATLTGDTGFNQSIVRANTAGTLLDHGRFSQGDPGFESNLDFDSTAPGVQTLANDAGSTVNFNGGTGLDSWRVLSDRSGNPFIEAELNFDGGTGQDFPLRVETGAGDQTVTLSGGGTVGGATGLPVDYTAVDSLALFTGEDNDTIQVNASPVGGAQVFAESGDDRIVLADGVNLGHRFDAGAGTDTVDYGAWTTAVNVGAPIVASFRAVLNGVQENLPNASPNAGTGQVFFTDLANPSQPFDYSLAIETFAQADVSDSHIHSGAPGVNGPVIFGIGPGSGYTGSGNLSKSGTDITDPDITEPALRTGNTYFNVHTNAFSGGEIRGQITLDQDFGYGQPATGTGPGSGAGVTATENFVGGSGPDVIRGNPLANSIVGGGGADQLFGEDGDDSFYEGDTPSGSDTIDGGAGADGASYAGRPADVTLNLSSSAAGEDGESSEDDNILSNVENGTGGDGDDALVVNPAANLLVGGPGDDFFDAGATASTAPDTFDGSEGGENEDGDVVAFGARANPVNVDLSSNVAGEDGEASEDDDVRDSVESAVTGSANDTLTGNGDPNTLTGGGGADSFLGNPGDDQLVGETGSDSFDERTAAGGAGADSIDGGANGGDVVRYDDRAGSVTVDLTDGDPTDGESGEGDDVEATVEQAVGGAAADTLIGNANDNVLTGGLGADILRGDFGEDTLNAADGVADLELNCGGGAADVVNRDPVATDPDAIVSGCETVNPPTPPPPPPDPASKIGVVTAIAAKASGAGSKITLATGSSATCPPGATAACTLTASASAKIPKPKRAKAAKVLGSLERSVAVGQTSAPVSFVVSKKLSKAWREARKLKVAITIDLAVPGGEAATRTASVRLKAPKRR